MSTLTAEIKSEGDEVQQKDVKTDENSEDTVHPATSDRGHVSVVAGHYNALEEKGLEMRSNSRIYYMRNFNNWIKSVLINQYLTKIQEKKKYGETLKVLDIGCGKGGDLLKWKVGRISHLVCADVAEVSVEQCKQRYLDLKRRSEDQIVSSTIFTAEFIHADCTKERLRYKYKDPSIKFDLVSCQFAFHYCFESFPQADIMLRNIAECLKVKGYFIGTTTDANEIMKRTIKSGKSSFGNSIHKVAFECPVESLSSIPLFGAKYNFDLEGVVSCPEFLVHFPTFVRLAEKHGLRLVCKEKFLQIFQQNCKTSGSLLHKMKALETYSIHANSLVGDSETSYEHGKMYLKELGKPDEKIGTLSKEEWEVISLYLAFAFEKVSEV